VYSPPPSNLFQDLGPDAIPVVGCCLPEGFTPTERSVFPLVVFLSFLTPWSPFACWKLAQYFASFFAASLPVYCLVEDVHDQCHVSDLSSFFPLSPPCLQTAVSQLSVLFFAPLAIKGAATDTPFFVSPKISPGAGMVLVHSRTRCLFFFLRLSVPQRRSSSPPAVSLALATALSFRFRP